MVLLDKLFDYFFDHAAVLNHDEKALQQEVELVKRTYGRWFKVKGFTDYQDFFLALHLAKAKRCPFSVAFLRDTDANAELIIKKSDLTVQTYKYRDTQTLKTMLPALR